MPAPFRMRRIQHDKWISLWKNSNSIQNDCKKLFIHDNENCTTRNSHIFVRIVVYEQAKSKIQAEPVRKKCDNVTGLILKILYNWRHSGHYCFEAPNFFRVSLVFDCLRWMDVMTFLIWLKEVYFVLTQTALSVSSWGLARALNSFSRLMLWLSRMKMRIAIHWWMNHLRQCAHCAEAADVSSESHR